MACFLVPTAEAVVVTVVAEILKANEKKSETLGKTTAGVIADEIDDAKIAFSKKLMWLSYLLWGGSLLLAFEHLWHGEVVPWFPFLTAAANPADAQVMLQEMGSVGVSMAILVTVVWLLMVIASDSIVKRKAPRGQTAKASA